MLKFSCARSAVLGVVSRAVPRCIAQASNTCAGVLSGARGNFENDWVLERPGPYSVTQRCKRQETISLLLAEFQKLGLRKIRDALSPCNHGRLSFSLIARWATSPHLG